MIRLIWVMTITIVLLLAPALAATTQDKPAPTIAPVEIKPDAKMNDRSLHKGQVLEKLLDQKVTRVLSASPLKSDEYRSNVNVSVVRRELQKPEDKANASTKDGKKDQPPQVPLVDGNIFDLQGLIDKYEGELEDAKAKAAGPEKELSLNLKNSHSDIDDQAFYEVSQLGITLLLDDSVPKNVADGVKKDITDAFGSVFGDRLSVDVKTAKIKESSWSKAGEWAYRFQSALIAILIGASIIVAILMYKLIPDWQARAAKAFSVDLKKQEDSNEKIDEESKQSVTSDEKQQVAGVDLEMARPELTIHSLEDEAKQLEINIAMLAARNKQIPVLLIQEWLNSDTGMLKAAVMLETFAKNKIEVERIDIRTDLIKAMRAFGGTIKKLSIKDRRDTLEEVYWIMISTAFLGEERSISPFIFLESVDDKAVLDALATEEVEAKAATLLGLDEKRTAHLLSSYSSEERQKILYQIVNGSPMPADKLKELVERLRKNVTEITASQALVSSSGALAGVKSIVPILKQMDFAAQFATAKSLSNLEPALLNDLKNSYFNVAMLPLAKPEFLSSVFVDRESDWIVAAVSLFGKEFRDQIVAMLPPMQQRMLEGKLEAPVLPTFAMKVLEELNTDLLGQIQSQKITNADIFETKTPENGGGLEAEVAQVA